MNANAVFRYIRHCFPPLARLWDDREQIRGELLYWKQGQSFPPGHFHSPIARPEDLRSRATQLFDRTSREIPGIDLRWHDQIALFRELGAYYAELPFPAQRTQEMRYYFENGFFSYADGIILYGLLRLLRPRRIVEVGSGYSSLLILDTNERFLDGTVSCTFIDPHPQRLRSGLRPGDDDAVTILPCPVQEVDSAVFDGLGPGDILLVDSSHVAKVGSDVNQLLFVVLPRLRDGVWVHFHDVFYPFEYPRAWILGGFHWNEAYILRAFLQYNGSFQVRLWADALSIHEPHLVKELMPLCLENTGASLWLQKTIPVGTR